MHRKNRLPSDADRRSINLMPAVILKYHTPSFATPLERPLRPDRVGQT
jgi:hypothetical protein